MMEKSVKIPKPYQEIYATLTGMTDTFCDSHLTDEYKELCRRMALVLCRKGFPLTKGKPPGWAAGIVYTVGWVNFLSDPTQTPHMKYDDIAKEFGVSTSTMHAKSLVIKDWLDLIPMHPHWSLLSQAESNPMIWMLKVNGFLMDVRHAPREIQEEAFRKGLIPWIPTDRKEN